MPIDLSLSTNQDEACTAVPPHKSRPFAQVAAYRARVEAANQAGTKACHAFMGRMTLSVLQIAPAEAAVLPKLDLYAALNQRFGTDVCK